MLVFSLKEMVIHSSLLCVQETSFACFLTTKNKQTNKQKQPQESFLSLVEDKWQKYLAHGPQSLADLCSRPKPSYPDVSYETV